MPNIPPRLEHSKAMISELEDDMDYKFNDQEAPLTRFINQKLNLCAEVLINRGLLLKLVNVQVGITSKIVQKDNPTPVNLKLTTAKRQGRCSSSHAEPNLQRIVYKILKRLPNGDSYRTNWSLKLVNKDSFGLTD